jgi:predicted DNA-binding protein (UPF0278 family)
MWSVGRQDGHSCLAPMREHARFVQVRTPDRHAVAHRRAVRADLVEVLRHRIDMDVAGRQPIAMLPPASA